MLVWMTQLGLSFVLPLTGFLFLGLWLHRSLGWGEWTVWAGLILGISSAVSSLRSSLQAMNRMSDAPKKKETPPVSFNEHI